MKDEIRSLKTLMEEKDLRQVRERGSQAARKYTVNDLFNDRWSIPTRARYRLKIWFLNGTDQTYYSYDVRNGAHGTTHVDEMESLIFLFRIAAERHKGKYKSACIFMNNSADALTAQSRYDVRVLVKTAHSERWNHSVTFNQVGTDTLVNLSTVKQLPARLISNSNPDGAGQRR